MNAQLFYLDSRDKHGGIEVRWPARLINGLRSRRARHGEQAFRYLSRSDLLDLVLSGEGVISEGTAGDGTIGEGTVSGTAQAAITTEDLVSNQAMQRRLSKLFKILRSTLAVLITVAAATVLVAIFVFPVFRIDGTSMEPTLRSDDIVVALKGATPHTGDLIAFYRGNNVLVKRIIAGPGQWVDIDRYGNVTVDGEPLDEPYLATKARGTCDITLPYQVPESHYFVMGDERATSVDSRSRQIGCVAEDDIAGTIAFRVWPLGSAGPVASASVEGGHK